MDHWYRKKNAARTARDGGSSGGSGEPLLESRPRSGADPSEAEKRRRSAELGVTYSACLIIRDFGVYQRIEQSSRNGFLLRATLYCTAAAGRDRERRFICASSMFEHRSIADRSSSSSIDLTSQKIHSELTALKSTDRIAPGEQRNQSAATSSMNFSSETSTATTPVMQQQQRSSNDSIGNSSTASSTSGGGFGRWLREHLTPGSHHHHQSNKVGDLEAAANAASCVSPSGGGGSGNGKPSSSGKRQAPPNLYCSLPRERKFDQRRASCRLVEQQKQLQRQQQQQKVVVVAGQQQQQSSVQAPGSGGGKRSRPERRRHSMSEFQSQQYRARQRERNNRLVPWPI
ncbi:unnamed protein product [Trichogramma brassicae]|uniref:Uncharacterized protein n=1 Tax=Trichogramma brassicae TaxID=86971 RepID=A0A6H5IWN9_9HYME|nr:unnamed protein product [Trichogramma brassicae]